MTRRPAFSPYVILLLLGAWALLTIRIGSAWFGHQDANGAWISVAVRNYQLHGFFQLGGIIDQNTSLIGAVQPYTHHPPLVVWLSALPVLLFGYNEAFIRFVAASCTLIGAAALYVLARRLKGQKFARWSTAFYLLTPMMAYFGRMPDHEAPALMFSLLFAAVLVDWLRRPSRGRWWALVALTVLTCWTAWGGLIVIAVLGAAALLHTRQRGAILMLGFVAFASVIVLLGYYQVVFPDAISDLIAAFVWRTSTNTLEPGTVDFTAVQYLLRMLARLITLYTPSVFALALIGLLAVLRGRGWLRSLLVALLIGGFGYMLIFRNASYIHDYYMLYTSPALALLAGAAVTLLPRRAPRWLRPVVAALALVTLPATLYYLNEIYSSSDSALGLQFAQVIHDQTTPDDLIMSGLPSIGYALEFYAERAVQWNTAPADALERARQAGAAAYYLSCGDDPIPPDDSVHGAEVEIDAHCRLTRLR